MSQLSEICNVLAQVHTIVIGKLEAIEAAATLQDAKDIVRQLEASPLRDTFHTEHLCDTFERLGEDLREIVGPSNGKAQTSQLSLSGRRPAHGCSSAVLLEDREADVARLYSAEINQISQLLSTLTSPEDLEAVQKRAKAARNTLTAERADFEALAIRFRKEIRTEPLASETKPAATYGEFARALRQLIERPALADKLMDRETRRQAMEDLHIANDDDVYCEILNVLMSLEGRAKQDSQPDSQHHPSAPNSEVNDARDFMAASFQQLHHAYVISMVMSVTIFTMGIAFLVLSAVRSVLDPTTVGTSSVIAGVGLVQILALFYKNPLIEIGRAVSNSQQAKIAVTSYLVGISLVSDQIGLLGKPSDKHLKDVLDLTEKTLGLLETYTESGEPASPTSSPPTNSRRSRSPAFSASSTKATAGAKTHPREKVV